MSDRIKRTVRFGTGGCSRRRPAMLQRPVGYYGKRDDRIPETIRVSFSDGTTAVYELRVKQPEPKIYDVTRYTIGYQFGGDSEWLR